MEDQDGGPGVIQGCGPLSSLGIRSTAQHNKTNVAPLALGIPEVWRPAISTLYTTPILRTLLGSRYRP